MTNECPTCSGNAEGLGFVECYYCDGEGEECCCNDPECINCGGDPIECDWCNGSCEIECDDCEGTGEVKDDEEE